MTALLASIPSPGRSTVGPVHMYGLMLLLAIASATLLTGIRWTRRGGDWDLVLRVAVWGVVGGVIGARLYHDLTSWDEVPHTWWGWIAVWKGGLGIWGGILGGVLAGGWVVHRSGNSVLAFMDAVAPGLLLAEAVGRLGNYWNQELYGKPTSLPWGLEIDLAHRPERYLDTATFHPIFLYEILWCLLGVAVLLLLDRRFRFRPPALFALYIAWYTAFRTFDETLRVDPAHHVAGQRLNFWVSLAVFVAASVFFVWWQLLRDREPPRRQERRRPVPKGPAMAIPKSRVRPPR